LIGEYHSEVILGLTFLWEEKEHKHGKADKFPLMQPFPTTSVALHHGLFIAQPYSGCIHGIHHQHGIHKHDSITIIMAYIQLCEVLWKRNAGTKEQKRRLRGSGPGRAVGDPLPQLSNYPGHCGLGHFFSSPPSCVVAKSFKDPLEREVGGEWCTRVRMRLPTKLTTCSPSIRSTCLSRSGREPIHLVTSTNQRAMLPSGSYRIGGGSRPNVANIGLT
jgi:hypothetical protein